MALASKVLALALNILYSNMSLVTGGATLVTGGESAPLVYNVMLQLECVWLFVGVMKCNNSKLCSKLCELHPKLRFI